MFDVNVWVNAFLKPQETFAAQKTKVDFTSALVNYVIAGLIYGILFFALFSALGSMFGGLMGAAMFGGFGLLGLIIYPIQYVVGGLIFAFVLAWAVKSQGGSGEYQTYFYLMSLLAIPLAILSIIPLINFLAGLYALYLLYLITKEVGGVAQDKAIISMVIAIVVMAVVGIILGVIMGALFAASLIGGMGMMYR